MRGGRGQVEVAGAAEIRVDAEALGPGLEDVHRAQGEGHIGRMRELGAHADSAEQAARLAAEAALKSAINAQ